MFYVLREPSDNQILVCAVSGQRTVLRLVDQPSAADDQSVAGRPPSSTGALPVLRQFKRPRLAAKFCSTQRLSQGRERCFRSDKQRSASRPGTCPKRVSKAHFKSASSHSHPSASDRKPSKQLRHLALSALELNFGCLLRVCAKAPCEAQVPKQRFFV